MYRVLGPVGADLPDGTQLVSGGRAKLAVLALLITHPQDGLSVEALIQELYRDDDPDSLRGNDADIKAHISRLRRELGDELPTGSGRRYALRDVGDRSDLRRFQLACAAADKAERSGDLSALAEQLSVARDCWQGNTAAMRDLQQFGFARRFAAVWDKKRLEVVQKLAETLRRLRRDDEVNALLAVEQDLVLPVEQPSVDDAATTVVVGRDEVLAGLVARLREAAAQGGRFVVQVNGPPGAGVSAVVRRAVAGFSEVVWVEMNVGPVPKQASTVKRELLLGPLGLPRAELGEPAERGRQYAERLTAETARRRLVLVLDHVREAGQVIPLVPATDVDATVVVCSRAQLPGVPADGLVPVGPLELSAAVDLLRSIVGTDVVEQSRPAAYELVQLCERLPLWIMIVGQDIDTNGRQIASVVAELRSGETADGSAARLLLDHSLRDVPRAAQEAFALIGRLDAEDVTIERVAALQDVPRDEAASTLSVLTRAQLLRADGNRYRMPEIMRGPARTREPITPWRPALQRALLQLLAEAETVASTTRPGARPDAGSRAPDAFTWFEANSANITQAAGQGAHLGMPDYPARILVAVQPILNELLDTAVWATLLKIAQDAAPRSADPVATARLKMSRGQLLRYEPADYRLAYREFDEAVTLLRDTDDPVTLAYALDGRADFATGLAGTTSDDQWLEQAATDGKEAYDLFSAAGDAVGMATAANTLGEVSFFRGRPDAAIQWMERESTARSAMGDRAGQAVAQRMLGKIYLDADELDAAADRLTSAITIQRELGNRVEQARAYTLLGEVLNRRQQHAEALDRLERALAVLKPRHDRLWLAALYQSRGKAHAGLGNTAEARIDLREAIQLFDQAGRTDRADECRDALRRLG
ncbi:tetratricopeptide repeat protein [Paractinoplanes hotanensis]|uniref:Tetratricopeptide repeat protein n=1 Tax=Paractinoplanes hotanensis TaxID=2906497 RepID=A0ABT0Y812_9ACTN|nr:tetratricopeptide repeat protein [Actinoplanes hotanensis]MCM4082191.1 tetratricopeptide repeat protein [Actinoplanes hotanensis]